MSLTNFGSHVSSTPELESPLPDGNVSDSNQRFNSDHLLNLGTVLFPLGALRKVASSTTYYKKIHLKTPFPYVRSIFFKVKRRKVSIGSSYLFFGSKLAWNWGLYLNLGTLLFSINDRLRRKNRSWIRLSVDKVEFSFSRRSSLNGKNKCFVSHLVVEHKKNWPKTRVAWLEL